MGSHHFAVYAQRGQYQVLGRVVHIDDAQLRFRIVNVLRMRVDDTLTLFDTTHAYRIKIDEVGKQHISGTLLATQQHQPLEQQVDLLLPVLEKESLEVAITHAAMHQVRQIQLVVTHKSRTTLKPGEHDRLIRVVHAAQEQAKQFIAPVIQEPIGLERALENLSAGSYRLLACVQGHNIKQYMNILAGAPYTILTVGPEGDYTPEEYTLLAAHGFANLVMGQSVLKACDASALLCGLVRTIQSGR